MGNTCFKFQPDRTHGLSARMIEFFDLGFYLFLFIYLIRLIWLCLDGFEGKGVADEMRILSRFFLPTLSLLFACVGSF